MPSSRSSSTTRCRPYGARLPASVRRSLGGPGIDDAVNMARTSTASSPTMLTATRSETNVMQRLLTRRLPDTGKKVAVVGAGPTVWRRAFYLALLGHKVTVFDENSERAHAALPVARIPPAEAVVAREVNFIKKLGCRSSATPASASTRPRQSLSKEFDSVFLALGTWKPRHRPAGRAVPRACITRCTFWNAIAHDKDVRIGQKVVVIGGGNAAIDPARTAARMVPTSPSSTAASAWTCRPSPRRSTRPTRKASSSSICAPPHRIISDGQGGVKAIEVQKTTLGEFGVTGRRRPVPTDESLRMSCDTIILPSASGRHRLHRRLAAGTQAGRHHQGRPPFVGDQPARRVCRRRRGDRSLERVRTPCRMASGRPR